MPIQNGSKSPAFRRRVAAQMADYSERLAKRVRYERERKQWSQEELALRAGLNPKTIERIEEQEVENPRGNTIRSLAGALDLEPHELNPPPELEEERLERLEEKIDGIQSDLAAAMAMLRHLVGDAAADEVLRAVEAAESELQPAEPSKQTPAAASQ